jgi:RNA polymerase primary sigma factor
MFNVVNPDDVVAKYGADTLRLYEMFLGPLEMSKPWDTNGIDGVHRFLRKWWNMFETLSTDEPTAEELAERTGIDIKKVNEYRAIVKEPTSLDVSIDDDGEATVGDLVADEEIDPLEKLYKEEMGQNIQKVLSTLDDKERDVLTMRFGLDGSRPKTLDEVGQIYSLSKERIRQIEAKALTKLRHPVRARLLQDCLEV